MAERSQARRDETRFAAFYKLSPKGRAVVQAGLDAGATQRTIQLELARMTGEEISNGSLGRYAKAWALRQKKLGQVEELAAKLVERSKANDVEAEDFARAILQVGLLANQDDVEGMELGTLLAENRRMVELGLKRKELELKKAKLELVERELKLHEKREERMRKALEDELAKAERGLKKGDGTVSQGTVDAIRRMYGLLTEAEAA
ncbi:MAG: DUF3486 family protein [Acidobacteria bacterium]|nr:DUF3486 family protein [Acidobacteriota bacterium]